jgi:hypothetical protein
MRAMSVPVDEVSDISGFVLPRTHVDVLAAIPGGGPTEKPFSKIVLQNVEVLAVAQEIEHSKDQPQLVKVVTLLVTPEQAERLALASREGTLHLVMRSYNDQQIVATRGANLADLIGNSSANQNDANGAATVPAQVHAFYRRPPAPIRVEVLRNGKESQTISFVRQQSHEDFGGYWAPQSRLRSAAPSGPALPPAPPPPYNAAPPPPAPGPAANAAPDDNGSDSSAAPPVAAAAPEALPGSSAFIPGNVLSRDFAPGGYKAAPKTIVVP